MSVNPKIVPTASEALYDRAQQVMPGGCSRNTVLRKPHPLYVAKGDGCYVTDIEGVTRIDFANNMASLIHGHAHPVIVAAVSEQLKRGTAFTLATEQEIIYAEAMCERVAAFENIRFVNSGTEAVMSALKASRAYTGRPKIAKVEGAYHGIYDFAEVSQTSTPANWGREDRPASVPVSYGTPKSTLDDVVVIPFNDAERAIEILDAHADELACVLLDLVPHRIGLMPATTEFVNAIRDWTRKNAALLVCDEVITFRCRYQGAQAFYDIEPDLTAMGKMIGGGFPVGALAGSRKSMSVMDPHAQTVLFPHSGTFSANPITMTAGHRAMQLFDDEAITRLNDLGQRARDQLSEAIRIADIPACVTGASSMFRILMKPSPPKDYRSGFPCELETAKLQCFIDYVTENGVLLIGTGTGMLSTPMGVAEIDRLCDVALKGFRHVKQLSNAWQE
jgi:glutamate-1-semialdehyde 2,1-aminomutase